MGTDITGERNVEGQTLQVRGIYRGWTLHERGMYRGQTLQVGGMYRGQTFHLREMYSGQKAVCKMEITLMDITLHCLRSSSQEPSKCLFNHKIM